MQDNTQVKEETTISNEQRNNQLSAAIAHALEMEKLFKLYSYRIIGHDQFIEFTQNTLNDTNAIFKKA